MWLSTVWHPRTHGAEQKHSDKTGTCSTLSACGASNLESRGTDASTIRGSGGFWRASRIHGLRRDANPHDCYTTIT